MTTAVVAFFGNKGGVGTTFLVYHLAWMMVERGVSVVAMDLDPQANLTSNFLEEEALEDLWPGDGGRLSDAKTVYGSLAPLIRGTGDIDEPRIMQIAERLHLLPGDLALSKFEDELSSQWSACLGGQERAFRVISAFWRLAVRSARQVDAQVVLMDVGPNLGAINRSALIAADHVVIPLAADLFSVQGLRNLGPALRSWRREWRARLRENPDPDLELPAGQMCPAGYVVLGHGVRLGQPVRAYRDSVLAAEEVHPPTVENDPYCLAQLKHYRSLMPLSYEARKPIFLLRPADGAFGGHMAAVREADVDFRRLSRRILGQVGAGNLVKGCDS